MASVHPCVYCLEIPEIDRGRHGRVERCPLCKTERLVAAGQSYRLRTEDGEPIPVPPLPMARWPWLAGCAAALVMAGAWWAAQHFGASETPVPYVAPPVPVTWEDEGASESLVACAGLEALPFPRIVEVVAQPPAKGVNKPAGQSPVNGVAKGKADEVAAAPTPALPATPARQHPPLAVAQSIADLFLSRVPELSLEGAMNKEVPNTHVSFSEGRKEHQARMAAWTKLIKQHSDKKVDGFIKHLKETHADFSGLPFIMGSDCQLVKAKAEALQTSALLVRETLGQSSYSRHQPTVSGTKFWDEWKRQPAPSRGSRGNTGLEHLKKNFGQATLPALMQILQPENNEVRTGLVAYLRDVNGEDAAKALARLVLFDPEEVVRQEAFSALRKRARSVYLAHIVKGLRYPWAPVAYRAADALVALDAADQLPLLVQMLDEPAPNAPFMAKDKGKDTLMIRELVKINHHRNCMLCHAVAANERDPVVALVPNPYSELPPSTSTVYYAMRSGEAVVRADVTYLRQDFSLMLPVANAEHWPIMQRFDFLVRTRPATEAEAQAGDRDRTEGGVSEHKQAILHVLRTLTGTDNGTSAAAWRQLVGDGSRQRWFSRCEK